MKVQAPPQTDAIVKRVSLFIQSRFYHLTGNWEWDLHTDAVFCSDVMVPAPEHFLGTKAIIHPDDVAAVREELAAFSYIKFINPSFRIITSYGSIKTLSGKLIALTEDDLMPVEAEDSLVRKALTELKEHRDVEHLQLSNAVWDRTERIQQSGAFYINTRTHRGWYSDNVFRIYGLPPQSLNPHLHTFSSYIHPDDSAVVTEAFDRAYHGQVPLHIHYRIISFTGEEKYLKLVTQWMYSVKGDLVLSGIIKDETEEKQFEDNQERLQQEISFQKQMVFLDEQVAQLGHWYINLLTRKIVYSENCYRIHGVKPRIVLSGIHTFNSFIHADDQEKVQQAFKRMQQEHNLPEIEYRIIRPDGKTRYLKQSGKSLAYAGEMVIYGILQDVTAERMAALNLQELRETNSVQALAIAQAEQVALTGNWLWDLDSGKHNWSEGFYFLMGYKFQAVEPSPDHFLKQVYNEDRKKLRNEMDVVARERKESVVYFRLTRFGSMRQIKASFHVVVFEERNFLITTLQDVTEIKSAEHHLHEKIRLAAALTDHIFDRISITDTNNNIVFWSRQCELLYQKKREEVLGKNYFDVLPHAKTEQGLGDFARALKNEKIFYAAAWSVLHKEYQDQHIIPLLNESEEVFGLLHINRNISREVELQRSLSERLRFIESLVESSVDRVIVLDRNMNYQYWNKRAEEYYGISKKEVLQKNILEVFPGFVNDPSYQEFRKVLKGDTVHISALENLEKKKGYFETYLIPIKDESELVIGVLWVVHNLISEYRLLQQQRKATYILETINEVYIELDDDARLKYVNRKGEDTWMREKAELIGRSIWELLPVEKDSDFCIGLEKCLEEKKELRGEFFVAGLNRWLYISVTPGEHGLILLMYDIQEAKQAREQLTTEHRRLKEAQAIGQVGSFEWELEGDNIYWSDEMYRMHGLEPQSEPITLSSAMSFMHPDDLADARDLLKECKKPGFSISITNRIIRRDGAVRMVKRMYQSHTDATGKVTHISGTVQDITEQKMAEETITKHLNILQQTENLANSGSWEYDLVSGNFIWSDGMYRLFGLQAGTQVAPEFYIEVAIEEDKTVAQRIIHEIKKGEDFEEVLRVRNKDEIRYLKIKGSLVKSEDNASKKMYGVDLDITEARKASDEIEQSRHMLEQTAKASPDAIIIYDLVAQQPVYLNTCLSEWIGYTNEELRDMGFRNRLNLIAPDDRKRLVAFNQKMLEAADGEIKIIEYCIQAKNGKNIWIRNRSRVFRRDEQGKVIQMLSVLQDHTREMQLRQQLMQRTEYAESVIDASIDRIIVLDLEQRVIAWNRRSEEVTGIKKENALGKTIRELFPKAYEQEIFRNAMRDALAGNPVYLPAQKAIYTNSYYERFYIPLKNGAGAVYAVLNLMHDVSEMVSRTEELKQLNKTLSEKNRELELKNDEITHFAFVASHDLKEPLRKINTFASWLADREKENISGTGLNYLDKISQAVKRMDMLIADIMLLTKIHADNTGEHIIDISDLLDQVKEELKEDIQDTGATITAEHLPVITGNEKQLYYLLHNLLSNALKFQPKDNQPVVAIWSEQVAGALIDDIQAHKELDYIRICISDNGIGFENNYNKKIFQVFQRLHGRQEYTGTGMGLAICKKIMENHHGFITAEGKPGEGSLFSCYFPS